MKALRGIFVGAAVAGVGLAAPAHAAEEASDWAYSGAKGPGNWGRLSVDFELCESGLQQSPIDLGAAAAIGDLEFSVDYGLSPLVVRNSGKAVQADFEPGSYMTSGGKVFALVQVHFHTPSEHVFDGEHYPLAAHFVHATDDGELAVLGVMFEPGRDNPELEAIIDAAEIAAASPTAIDGVMLDPRGLLPDEREVYRYMGSLTTPPCSEGVNWHVAKDVIETSADQIERLTDLMGHSARPVMPLNGRLLVAPE